MTWRIGNNGSGKNIWFCLQDGSVPLSERYHCDKRGDLIRYGTWQAAQKVVDRLNGLLA